MRIINFTSGEIKSLELIDYYDDRFSMFTLIFKHCSLILDVSNKIVSEL